MVEQWNRSRYGGTMKQRWWNSGTVKGEQWNRDGGRVDQ